MIELRIGMWGVHVDFGVCKACWMSIIGKLLPFCRGKRKIVPQVNVSIIPVESRNREELVGLSLLYTCGEKRQIFASET